MDRGRREEEREGECRREKYFMYSLRVALRISISNALVQTVAHTSDHVTNLLENHYLWAELTVLARFLLALSFNNKVNGTVACGSTLSHAHAHTYI